MIQALCYIETKGQMEQFMFGICQLSNFFVNIDCHHDYQVCVIDANLHLRMECLKIMVDQLCFNICKIEDSRIANADMKDLQTRIKQNISDSLQYSSLYWSNHLCFGSNIGDQHVWAGLKEFFEGVYPIFHLGQPLLDPSKGYHSLCL